MLRSKLSKTSYIQRANDRQNTVSKEKQSKGKERKSKAKQRKAKQRKAKSEYLWGTLFAGCPSPSHQSLRVLGRQFVWLAWFPAALNSIGALVESPPLPAPPPPGTLVPWVGPLMDSRVLSVGVLWCGVSKRKARIARVTKTDKILNWAGVS